MLSVSEGRQINTTKHFGGGVNVSAGATLLIKAGALTLTNSYTPHTRETHLTTCKQIHKNTYARMHAVDKHPKTDCILNPAEPPTFTNKMGS